MSNIRFRSAAHRDFFLEMMNKSKVNDCYHRAFFYVMGIAAETRANINQMFDFKTDCIEPEGMAGRQAVRSRSATLPLTSGTVTRKRKTDGILRQMNYSVVNMLRTLLRVLR